MWIVGREGGAGSNKKAQLKRWSQYFLWLRQGNAWKITKIYNVKTKSYQNKIKKEQTTKQYKELVLDYAITKQIQGQIKLKRTNFDKAGVYIIQLNNQVYIGETLCLIKRLKGHMRGAAYVDTKQMMLDGAIFKPLWINTDETLSKEDLKKILVNKEAQFIQDYKECEYTVLNNILYDGYYTTTKRNTIKVKADDFNFAIKILQENGIEILPHNHIEGDNTDEDR